MIANNILTRKVLYTFPRMSNFFWTALVTFFIIVTMKVLLSLARTYFHLRPETDPVFNELSLSVITYIFKHRK